MADMLRADITALRIMAAGVRTEADAIAAIDPVDLIAAVGRSMPNSAIGASAATAGQPLLAAVRHLADGLHTLADSTDHTGVTYEETEHDLKNQLDSYLHTSS